MLRQQLTTGEPAKLLDTHVKAMISFVLKTPGLGRETVMGLGKKTPTKKKGKKKVSRDLQL